jgi:hypothetical protein
MAEIEHKARKRSEAARKTAQTRAIQKRAREQWEQRQDEDEVESLRRQLHESAEALPRHARQARGTR